MKHLRWGMMVAVLGILASCTTDPKVKSQNYVDKGNKYLERNKLKEASIMYRRALQTDAKNAAAWYKLGLIDIKQGNVGEARGAFIRVTDLVEGGSPSGLPKESIQDAYTRSADIDYLAFLSALERKQQGQVKEFRKEIRIVSKKLTAKFPGSFDAYRIGGLYDWAQALTPGLNEPDEQSRDTKASLQAALDNFLKADQLKPYDPSLGFAIVSTYFDTQHPDLAEKYAREMISRKKADYRVYDSLWRYYYGSGHVDQAEEVRKQETVNNPKDSQAWLRLAAHYATVHHPAPMIATLHNLTNDLKTFPNGYMLVGDFYYANYDLKDAVEEYKQGVNVDPPNRNMYQKKAGEALSLMGKFDDAEKYVNAVLKDDPKDAEAIAMKASLQLNHAKPGDADRIIAELQPLLAKTPGDKVDQATVIHFNLGRAYALKGDPQNLDQARLQFQEVINIRNAAQRPPYIPAVIALSQMQLQRGENPMAIQNAEMILRVAPLNVTAHLIRTMGLANIGEYDKARKELDAILKYQPRSTDTRFQIARLDLLEKKYPEAEAMFMELSKMDDPRGFSGLLEMKVRQGKTDEAIQMVKTALAKTPNNPGLQNALANLNFGAGKYAEAVGMYRNLLDQNPNVETGLREMWSLRMGESLRRTGDDNGAMNAFNRASQISPKDTRPRLELAMLLDSTGKQDEARKAYEEILKIQPDEPVALNNLAYYKADSDKDLDTALSYAQRAQKKSPKDLNIIDTIGLIYYRKDLLDESSRLFTELVGKDPKNPTFHLHLAMALYKKGDKTQAKRELDAARRNRPTNREQDQIKDLMSKIG